MEDDLHLLLIGVNHRTAGIDQREALAFTRDERLDALAALAAAGAAEALVVTTCNRTEFYVVDRDAGEADRRVRAAVAGLRGADLLAPGPLRHTAVDADVVRHLCRVASGLDSMVLGDLQILGQLKEAIALARLSGTLGPVLDRLSDCALRAGKRARAETGVSAGVVSLASAAVALLEQQLGGIAGRRVLVIGAGETARLVVKQLALHRPAEIVIANRTAATAGSLAAGVGGRAVSLDVVPTELALVDAAVSATGAPGAVVSAGDVEDAMRRRTGARLVLIDLAVPRDVEPAAAAVPGVHLHGLDAIQRAVDSTLSRRQSEVPKVEGLVNEELARFEAWRRSRAVTPTVRDLRAHFERLRVEELARLKHVDADERARAERLTQALVNRLLHVPTVSLKNVDAGSEDGRSRLDALRDLFALDGPAPRRRASHGR
jgi:glutamyl-tRNA reductase